ncbi:hypothetical protein Poli38472_008888 [Pythium oligandrum]|uniref:alpha-1,2-Mannosidase n=1 Tax=Pythium oligandrum TaxID=41045 RepID=A0A8K1C4H6_PYTOL|nr:hypothetical protein Poli38472_008888 [Pythium oligandrum]|eukprot:TMW56240.1 hypothetical protein Poli38472_008888 [Pythium oligandrum]
MHMCLLLLLAVCFVVVRPVSAEIETIVDADGHTAHFNGIRVLSGSSFRSFTNRFKRQLRGVECLTFHEAGNWWHYEWCVGRHVQQLHRFAADELSAAKTPANDWRIVLGRFARDTSKTLRILPLKNFSRLRNPEQQGYYAVQSYAQGEQCTASEDQSKSTTVLNRSVSIQYKCCIFRANETYIEAIDEPSTCQYVLSVCTPVACGFVQKDQYVLNAPAYVGEEERLGLVQTVKDMFYHAYHGYLKHAYPLDALLPISCRGETFELGKIQMLTLIDTLDTLAILEDAKEFQHAVHLVVSRSNFDLNTEVSVFETTIRVLGGLLSAHLFAIDEKLGLFPPGEYKNELLTLAVDLGDRLMPAFDTPTGIPYGTVNLRHGVPKGETTVASTAGAGSLSMEFTMLSALTGDAKYATASRKAVRALFERRSSVGLLGKHIDTKSGDWTETISGPGSNSDSFYEYLWKMYATFNDQESLDMFDSVYTAVLERNLHGDWFADVSMWSGCGHGGVVFENLVAFWPGMQASLGHLHPATRSMNSFYRVWREYGFVPEQFNVMQWKPVRDRGARYPLRPELIESTFYMHEATNDSSWLRAGAHFVHSLQKHTKTKCGYATVKDIETKELEDNMPSFFLSETCKYLYLLFNTTHFLRNGNYVFTTEAHPFPILPSKQVDPILLPTKTPTSTSVSRGRMCRKPAFWDALGYQVDYEGRVVDKTEACKRPVVKPAKIGKTEVIASADASFLSVDDWMPMIEKQLREQLDNLQVKNLKKLSMSEDDAEIAAADYEDAVHRDSPSEFLQGGPRVGVVRLDKMNGLQRFTRVDTGEWLETTGLQDPRYVVLSWFPERRGDPPFDVMPSPNETPTPEVISPISDEDLELASLLPFHRVYDFTHGRHEVALRRICELHVDVPTVTSSGSMRTGFTRSFKFSCASAGFGVHAHSSGSHNFKPAAMVLAEPLDACGTIANAYALEGKLAIVKRGTCFFESKVRHAARAGAIGVIVVNNEDEDRVMVMAGSDEFGDDMEDDDVHKRQRPGIKIPSIMVPRRVGEWLNRQMIGSEGEVRARIELMVRDRSADLLSLARYMELPDENRRVLDAPEVYPRIEGKPGNLRLLAPEWGVELLTVRRSSHGDVEDFAVSVISELQTFADSKLLSP